MSQPITISCPHCLASNRLPSDKLSARPTCGKCKNALFDGHPLAVNSSQFDKIITNTEIPVVVDFWADWCGPCKAMAPVFQEAARTLEPRFRFIKVDTEANPGLSQRYAIRSIPTLLVIKNGKEIKRQAGAGNLTQLTQWLLS